MVEFLQNLKITNFRGLNDIEIHPSNINIVVGPNNSGKSSILEAIGLLLSSRSNFKDSLENNLLDYLFQIKDLKPKYLINNGNEAVIKSNLDKYRKLILQFHKKSTPKSSYYVNFETVYSNQLRTKIIDELSSIYRENLSFFPSNKLSRFQDRYDDVIERKLFNNINNNIREEISAFIDDLIYKRFQDDEGRDILFELINDKIDFLFNTNTLLFVLNQSKNENIVEIIENDIPESSKKYSPRNRSRESPLSSYPYQSPFEESSLVTMRYHEVPNPTRFKELHDRLVNEGKFDYVIQSLRKLIPEFEDLRYTKNNDELVITIRNEQLALFTQGEGFLSLVNFLFLITLSKNKILLVEEPEISLHPRYLDLIAKLIVDHSKDTQFFLTTHNHELLDYIMEWSKQQNKLDKVNIIRTHYRKDLEEIDIEEIDGTNANAKLEQIKIDLRGI